MREELLAAARECIRRCATERGREGFVVGISGGVDSAVAARLACEEVGPQAVLGVFFRAQLVPAQARCAARAVAEWLGVELEERSIRGVISAALPPVGRLVLGVASTPPGRAALKRRVVRTLSCEGGMKSYLRPRTREERVGVAYTRMVLRLRMACLYAAAESRQRLLLGTTNRTEWLTGLFVPWGDAAADLQPLLHMYKTEVMEAARELGVPRQVLDRAPNPDILPGLTDELALGIPYEKVDAALAALEGEKEPGVDEETLDRVRTLVDSTAWMRAPVPAPARPRGDPQVPRQ